MSKVKLRSYQRRAVGHMLANPHTGLLAKPGLGKTLTTLATLGHLFKDGEIEHALIIAPKTVCELVWPQERRKWGFPYGMAYMHGSKRDRVAQNPPAVTITTPDTFTNMVKSGAFDGRFPWDALIVDESSLYKSPKTARFKAIKKVLTKHEVPYTYILTGTPTPNHLLELWPQMHIADQGVSLGKSFYSFRSRFFHQAGWGGYEWKPFENAPEKVYELVKQAGSAMVLMNDELGDDLQPLNVVDIPLALPPGAQRAYHEMETKFIAELGSGEVTAANAAVKAGKLLQMTAGAVYTEDRDYEVVHAGKFDALRSLVEERQGAPLLVFYQYIHEGAELMTALKGFEVADLSRAKDKPELAKRWANGEIEVLLAHPKSAAHGLNLQCPDADVCWTTLPWSGELYEQGNSRVNRQGQTTKVTSYRLIIPGTIDEIVRDRLADRQHQQQNLFDYLKGRYERSDSKT